MTWDVNELILWITSMLIIRVKIFACKIGLDNDAVKKN
jgi:hypothetical protein